MKILQFHCTILAVVLILTCPAQTGAYQFEPALPGYEYSFPRDHASHESYKTEWWYYTGHLLSSSGRRFGFELTFFRIGNDAADMVEHSPWSVKNIYLTHFAVTDESGKRFEFSERANRHAFGQAGAESEQYHVWNESWSVIRKGEDHILKAGMADMALDLVATSLKPPAIHGVNGVSQKATCRGCASHYYSLTRMKVSGNIRIGAETMPVTGSAWMDHEFGSNQLTSEQVGWDWFSVQLSNDTELMAYVMRRKNGTIDPNSSGTIVYPDGHTRHLSAGEFLTTAGGQWHSPHTGASYPSGWRLLVPGQSIELTITPVLPDQELETPNSTGVSYWEGACQVTGSCGSVPVTGQAYVELTGYAKAFHSSI